MLLGPLVGILEDESYSETAYMNMYTQTCTYAHTHRDRFNMLLGPLVGILEDESCGEAAYNKRVEELVAPAVAQFAVAVQQATGNDLLWKSLNNK